MIKPEYLGDAVYATPWDDCGIGGLMLTTDHHLPAQAGNVIYLEPGVLAALDRYLKRMKAEADNG